MQVQSLGQRFPRLSFFALAAALAACISAWLLPVRAAEGVAAAPSGGIVGEAAKALAKLDDEWSNAASTEDAEKVASFYAVDCTAYPPDEPVCHGRAAAERVWAAYFADPAFVSISWKSDSAEVAASGDLGFTAGAYEFTVKLDGKPVTLKGKFLCVWRKQADGSWKATHDMWNADSK